MIEDEELEAIEVESNHMIEINSFVPRSQIDERFLDSPYYIGPSDPVGQEAFAVIREAMRGKAMVALGRVIHGRHSASVERSCARLLKHRCRVARYQALLVGRDDPDRNGRVVGADQSLAAVFIARGIENGARPA